MRAALRAGGIATAVLACTRLLACSSSELPLISDSTPTADAAGGTGSGSSDGAVLDDAAPVEDGAVLVDGGGDADADADAGIDSGPLIPCAAYDAAWFCADFDKGTDPADGWSFTLDQGEGGVAFDSTHFVSPARSLYTTLRNDTPGSTNYAHRLVKLVDSAMPRYELSFYVQIAQATDVGGAVAIGEMSFQQNSAGDQFIFIGAAPSGLVLGDDWYPTSGAPVYSSTPIAPLPTAKFIRVGLVVELAAAVAGVMSGTTTVSVDGVTVVDHAALKAPIADTARAAIGVGPASTHVATTDGWFDNVLVYPQPP